MAAAIVAVMLLLHAALVGYSATRHSPTLNEPAHLVAGLTHWRFGRFDVYRVNPPLVHYVAALPVMAMGFQADWTGFYESPGARPEYQMGEDFVRANGARTAWLMTIARWACIPFSLIGGVFCYIWSKELWGSNLAGLISLFLWCIDPNIVAHAELITSDCAATSLGIAAAYLFWRWLREPSWRNALAAGAFSGLALLTKVLWVILYVLWPALWVLWLSHGHLRRAIRRGPAARILSPPAAQLAFVLIVALYMLNLGYCFDGTCTRLGDFTFVSRALTGAERSGAPGNRFADSWVRQMPVPVPKQYLLGIDLQKCDLENYGQPSYLRGEWKDGGWWYYYLYGLAVKMPHGSQLMIALAALTLVVQTRPMRFVARYTPIINMARSASGPFSRARDLLVLITPSIAVLILVSSQLAFNHHVRYVLPVLGFAYIFTGCTSWWFLPTKRSHCSDGRSGAPERRL